MAMTTFPGDYDTTSLAQDLVGAGLAACVNISPSIKSVYTWEGVPQVDQEQQLYIKTTTDQIDALWDVLKSRHPYEVPELVALPAVAGLPAYLHWVTDSTRAADAGPRDAAPATD